MLAMQEQGSVEACLVGILGHSRVSLHVQQHMHGSPATLC